MRELVPVKGINVNSEIDNRINEKTDSCIVKCEKLTVPIPVPTGMDENMAV